MSGKSDLVIAGAGPAGIAAACAAAVNGIQPLLIEANPYPGGELVSGLPVDGALNARGEWLVGGPARELFDRCELRNGYIGPLFDWRLNWGVCIDPVAMRPAISEQLEQYGVRVFLGAVVSGVEVHDGQISALTITSRQGTTRVNTDFVVDASGDGTVAALAGADFQKGGTNGELQPVSLTFRMSGVDIAELMAFIRDHPDELILAESPIIDIPPAECALRLYERGLPFVPLSATGPLLRDAVQNGEMAPCTAVFMWPTSIQRAEIGLNVTRLAGVDATDNAQWSGALAPLLKQVEQAARVLRARVPGFRNAVISDMAHAVGIRETRRILGENILTEEAVRNAGKNSAGIARGAHHIDVHGKGTAQERIPVAGGGSYDIPFGCLEPRGLRNLLVAGRCLSSTRPANGSARVMGTCLATGQAAGTAAALCLQDAITDSRRLPVEKLRQRLAGQGAVIDGIF